MSIQLNDLCPCDYIMNIEGNEDENNCTDCPYVPVSGENEAFELKETNIKDLLNSIEETLGQIITDMKYGISNQEIKEILTEVLVVIREHLKEDLLD